MVAGGTAQRKEDLAMTQEQWVRLKEIFGEALELEPGVREAYARDAVGGDDELLRELLRLIKESEHETDLLSRPVLADAKAVSRGDAPRFAPAMLLARRFRIVRFISRGGMGEVYEAEDVELGERVALKAIRQRESLDAEMRALFKREIQLARRVTHTNVCRIFDLVQHDDTESGGPTLLLSMELIEGQTLAEHLRLNGPLTRKAALPLIEEIAAGLQAIHDAGIIHGDLKPANVMLVAPPGETTLHARVMDFGMAFPVGEEAAGNGAGASAHRSQSETGDGPTINLQSPGLHLRGGTPDYFAPEQLDGEAATTATDVYALAIVIGEMLGVPREKRLKPDSEQMPGRWARLLRRCLAADPARRYKRPVELAEALRAAIHRKSNSKRMAVIGLCALVAIVVAAKRLDVIRGTANRLLLTEDKSLEVWRASPDGKWLAATSWDTGNLVMIDIGSGKPRAITHRGRDAQGEFGGAFGAVFSPDGRQIAYEWMNGRTDAEVRVIGTDGKGDHTLYHDANLYASLLDWSPDGTRLLVRVKNIAGEVKLGTLSAQDGSLEFLPKQPAGGWGGRILFGADSRSIVFDTRGPRNNGHEIHRLLLNGEESLLVQRTGLSSVIGWTPDRSRLIYSSDLRGQPGVWSVAVSARGTEGEAREIVPNAINWEPLGLSRNGVLFYRHDASSMDVYTAVLDLASGRTVSAPQRVTERFVGSYAFPSWSEDGTKLSLMSTRERLKPMIAIYETSSGAVRELQPELQFFHRPQWVEHGTAIMALGNAQDGRNGLFRIDPQSGESTFFRSTKDLEIYNQTEGVWSRDGGFYFNRYSDPRRGIFRLNIHSGERRVLYVPPPNVLIGMENLALSPDGRYLAFHARSEIAGTGSLMVIPADGGDARALLVVHRPESFPFASFTWTPDSKAVLSVRGRSFNRSAADERVSEIWLSPVDGSALRKIEFPSMFISCLRLSPDGKTIAFQVHHDRREIWVLQNFL
jgi:Tol biopolymer transport system component/tRNA A-37 threonylcarbamoyl transferase component Bud32